ncbi:RXRG [Bugula neritina]|uniref:RXRG n=1 Tax=Bugula neritina TaxID=10212 RepID=A0A7J7KQ79_BUGNE|nr:RXRG [Bugula neritina]
MNDWQEILINEVRSRRCLWDKSHGDYKDTRTVKSNNWVDVAKVMSEKTAKEWNGKNEIVIMIIIMIACYATV